ncbi:hypothetical protein HDV03_002762 [Kappamyces sp. JEL0829]|nr:hypothetical protein HDV03_002762 [Kappamyces sp. JEL0829]
MSKEHCLKHESYRKYAADKSNIIALSREFHGFYDALNTETPLFNLKFIGSSEYPETDGRYRVSLEMQVYSHEFTSLIFPRLREGSTNTANPLAKNTFVFVLNPGIFKTCMEWKHKKIIKQWEEYDSMDSAVP